MSSQNDSLSPLSSRTMIKKTLKTPRTSQILSLVLATSLVISGSVLAQQNLSIPTNLTNAKIAIRQIFLSPSGTDTSAGAAIKLNGTNGTIDAQSTISGGQLYIAGSTVLAGSVRFSSHPCNSSTGCVLTVNNQGVMSLTGDLSSFVGGSTTNNNNGGSGSTTSGDNKESYFAKKGSGSTVNSGVKEIFFADPSIVGNTNNVSLRIGISGTNAINMQGNDKMLDVGGTINSRRGFSLFSPINSSEVSRYDEPLQRTEATFEKGDLVNTQESIRMKVGYTPNINTQGYTRQNLVIEGIDTGTGAKVGINTPTYPSKTLDVRGDSQIVMGTGQESTIANNNTYMYFQSTGTTAGNSYSKLGAYYGSNPFGAVSLRLQTAGGSVAIGDVNPTAKLHVAGNLEIAMSAGQESHISNGSTYMYFQSSGSTSANSYSMFGSYFANNPTFAATPLRLQIAGSNVAIGNIDPQEKLHVAGNIRADAYYYNSDRRYKSDITLLDKALDKVLSLNGYSFVMKATKKASIGVIAQEVEKVFPQVVKTDKDGYKSVEYANLIAPVIEAIKSLNSKIEDLFDRYLEQQDKIEALEARIADLEKKIQ